MSQYHPDRLRKQGITLQWLLEQGVWKDGCLIWTGATDKDGYGKFGRGSARKGGGTYVNYRVHRVCASFVYGDIGAMYILHRCDNPPCYNPEHLFIGTARDNTQDSVQKGRQSFTGEKHHRAKLSDKEVIAIYNQVNPQVMPKVPYGGLAQVARQYGITAAHVLHIRKKELRRDILKDL